MSLYVFSHGADFVHGQGAFDKACIPDPGGRNHALFLFLNVCPGAADTSTAPGAIVDVPFGKPNFLLVLSFYLLKFSAIDRKHTGLTIILDLRHVL